MLHDVVRLQIVWQQDTSCSALSNANRQLLDQPYSGCLWKARIRLRWWQFDQIRRDKTLDLSVIMRTKRRKSENVNL